MLTHSEIEKWRIEEEGNDNDYKCLWSGPKMQMDGAKSTKKMTSRMSHLSRREWVWSRPLRAGPHPNLLGDGPCYAALQPLRLLQGQRQNQFIAICKSKSICKVVQEYERAVIFRLGRLLNGGAKGPGKGIY